MTVFLAQVKAQNRCNTSFGMHRTGVSRLSFSPHLSSIVRGWVEDDSCRDGSTFSGHADMPSKGFAKVELVHVYA